jgi:glutathione peroxidase
MTRCIPRSKNGTQERPWLRCHAGAWRRYTRAETQQWVFAYLPGEKGENIVTIYDIEVTTIDGVPQSLASYRGKVLLIVNVASKCGFTPQYAGLEALQLRHQDAGFEVLGFPCDQFGHQEPGNEEEIRNFCSLTYQISFPMFAKIEVNGDQAHPLYKFLKSEQKGLLGSEAIKWNFTKFLVNREGAVVQRYAPTATPESIENDLVALLR